MKCASLHWNFSARLSKARQFLAQLPLSLGNSVTLLSIRSGVAHFFIPLCFPFVIGYARNLGATILG